MTDAKEWQVGDRVIHPEYPDDVYSVKSVRKTCIEIVKKYEDGETSKIVMYRYTAYNNGSKNITALERELKELKECDFFGVGMD